VAVNAPKVSVVVPVYNVGDYLGKCLDSVLGQTLKDIEVICVDDGSTDSSPAVLARYAAGDSRVRVLSQANAGAGAARNRGLREARGEYVFFCDPDDWCERDMLKKMYARAAKLQCDVMIAGAYRHDAVCGVPYAAYPSSKLAAMPDVFSGRDAADFLFVEARANPWNKLTRRAHLVERGIEFQEQPRENDLYFSCVAVAEAQRVAVIDDAFYHYRVGRPGSLQDNVRADGRPILWLAAFLAVKSRLERDGMLETFALGLLRLLLGTGARDMVKQGDAASIECHYAHLRHEMLSLLDMCGERCKALDDFEMRVAEIVRGSESPLPLAAFLARHYLARSVGRGTAKATSLVRRLAVLRRKLRAFPFGGA